MSTFAKAIIAKIAHRIHKDPTGITPADAQKLARAWILLTEGRLP